MKMSTKVRTKSTVLLMDFDGTLYRGLFPYLFRGVANADLMLFLFFLNLFKWPRLFRILTGMLRLWFFERRWRYQYKTGRISLSEAEEPMIRFFAENVLRHCSEKDIGRAARLASSLCYGGAWSFLTEIRSKSEFVLVSKSFEFLLEKVKEKAYADHGLILEYYGIRTGYGDSIIQKDSVIRKEDKYSRVKDLLKKNRFQKAIVIGDTEDDMAIKDAAVETLGKPHVLFFAVNAKDSRIAEAADITYKSWKELKNAYAKRIIDEF